MSHRNNQTINCWLQETTTTTIIFFMSYPEGASNDKNSFTLYCKEASVTLRGREQWQKIVYVVLLESECCIARQQAKTKIQTSWDASTIARVWQWKVSHATMKFLYAVNHNDHGNQLILQEATTRILLFLCHGIAQHSWFWQGNARLRHAITNLF